MSKPYQGHCPICRAQLLLGDDDYLTCPEKHYLVSRMAFENAWDDWGLKSYAAEILLQELLDLNEKEHVKD